ncbi:unnamed protein product [Paramecium sonneborni]|uniref:Uncharacterized protein n=1 Tax=Paramecium sonneborni TaxID=65129 RepID=A0A8S1RL67_9CILI|nr:unnamed protein product [Paramecium sonneborni]
MKRDNKKKNSNNINHYINQVSVGFKILMLNILDFLNTQQSIGYLRQ